MAYFNGKRIFLNAKIVYEGKPENEPSEAKQITVTAKGAYPIKSAVTAKIPNISITSEGVIK